MTLRPGDRVGHYEIVGRLGAGGMGEVYRGIDKRLGRAIALKTLPGSVVAEPERLARFEREARVLATLNHANIAQVFGIEESSAGPVIVMELVEGEDLYEIIATGSVDSARRPQRRAAPGLTVADAVAIARQIADALDEAHQRGIVHRDLKPANVRVTAAGAVKVLDFGLAKAVAGHADSSELSLAATSDWQETRLGEIVGTVAYMSPEQASGQPVDKRTDIWAFGCVLYEMLTGRSPFRRETTAEMLAAVLSAEPDWRALPRDTPPAVRRLIGRCLHKNPMQRQRDIGDARHELDALEQAESEEAVPAAVATAESAVSRRRLLTGGALGLIGTGVGFGGGLVAAARRDASAPPTYRRLTFRRGLVRSARFGPDYRTVLYGALWDGDVCRTYAVRPESPESAPLGLPPATPLAVSAAGELALALGTHRRGIMTYGTLARVALSGGAPRELLEDVKFADWSPGGELAIVRRVNGREQLEFPIGNVLVEAAEGRIGFSFPRVSPQGDRVAFFELRAGLAGRATVVDRSGVRRATSPEYFNVFGLAWKEEEIWFTVADELPLFRNGLHAMAPDGSIRVVARVPGNASLHDVAPDGRALLARTDDRSGISVLAPGDALERDLSWLDAPTLADISPDGRTILFSEAGVGGGPNRSAYLRGTDGSPAVRLSDGFAVALAPAADRALVLVAGHLEVVPTGPGQVRRLERRGARFLNARWQPDGRHLVIRAQQDGRDARLYLLDVDGDTFLPITPEGVAVDPSWARSPDGTMVALPRPDGIEIHPVAGGPPRLVSGTASRDRLVAWIDDGLLVSDDPSTGGTLTRVNTSTGQRGTWKEITARDATGIMNMNLSSLVVTPAGDAYGYSWHRAISDLYIVEGLA